jgi:outer membrane protein assembly factor BamB
MKRDPLLFFFPLLFLFYIIYLTNMPFWNSDEKQSFTDESDNVSIRLTDQPYSRDDILICATHGHIYAVHKTTGSDIWDTKFPTGVMGNVISIFITDTDKLIVGGFGKTACMNLLNGQTIWINNMSVSVSFL